MRLAARQALGNLRQQITDLIIWEVMSTPIKESFQDEKFVESLINKLIGYWLDNFGNEERLDILLPEEDYKKIQETMRGKAQELLQQLYGHKV